MTPVLYGWGPSPFCLKIRAILDYKGIAYERVGVLGRNMFKVRRRGGVGKVPAIELDGRMIVDSTDIAYVLEARVPDPPVIPAGARERGLCHALEDWADEALYFLNLYCQWRDPAGRGMVARAFGRGPVGRAAYWWFRHAIRRQLAGQGTGRKSPRHIRADLIRELDAIDGLLAPGPYLMGEAPYLCDFALLGQLVYLSRTPVGAELLDGRHASYAYLDRMRRLRRAEPPAAD